MLYIENQLIIKPISNNQTGFEIESIIGNIGL
jgi:hypothetical protein